MPEYYAFERHPGIDLRGVDLIEATLQEAEFPGANLDGVVACDALANGIVLTGASLANANFAKAHLVEADFRDATADGTRFNRARLDRARFDRASLRGASFFDAELGGASFVGADVTGADFTHAQLAGAALSAAAPTNDMDCELFLDGDREALTERIRSFLDLTADGRWLTGPGVTLVVDDNERRGGTGFLGYPTSVEWYFAADVALPLRVALVGSIMRIVRVAGSHAVAACDYEDALAPFGQQ